MTEPSNLAVVGTGQVTTYVPGSSTFNGDFGVATMNETDLHDSPATAQNLDFGKWSKNVDSNITLADTLPHLTVIGTGDNKIDYYKFTIDQSMIDAAANKTIRAVFDIDKGYEVGEAVFLGSKLRLYDDKWRTAFAGTRHLRLFGSCDRVDRSSTTWLDDYLEYSFTKAGTYIVLRWITGSESIRTGSRAFSAVCPRAQTICCRYPLKGIRSTDSSSRRRLSAKTSRGTTRHRSLIRLRLWIRTAVPTGTPSSIPPSATRRSRDPSTHLTPYAKVLGEGDGSWDIYQFTVTPDMIVPDISSVTDFAGTTLGGGRGSFFEKAGIVLSGDQADSIWTLTLDGVGLQLPCPLHRHSR